MNDFGTKSIEQKILHAKYREKSANFKSVCMLVCAHTGQILSKVWVGLKFFVRTDFNLVFERHWTKHFVRACPDNVPGRTPEFKNFKNEEFKYSLSELNIVFHQKCCMTPLLCSNYQIHDQILNFWLFWRLNLQKFRWKHLQFSSSSFLFYKIFQNNVSQV